MTSISAADVLKQLGATPEQVDQELRSFTEAAKVLSSDHPRLIDRYPLQWVGIYQGRVAASARSMKSLLIQLEKEGVPASKTIIRFIDKEQRVLVL